MQYKTNIFSNALKLLVHYGKNVIQFLHKNYCFTKNKISPTMFELLSENLFNFNPKQKYEASLKIKINISFFSSKTP